MKSEAIKMPVLSDTMETGHLARWMKAPGDRVRKGDVLAEIESDKAAMDLEAFDDGWLAGPLAAPGSDLPVGAVLGYIVDTPEVREVEATPPAGNEDAAPAAATEPEADPQTQVEPPLAPPSAATPPPAPARKVPPADGALRASPYARALARELGIDPAGVASGPDGVVRSAQVIAAALRGPEPDLDAGPEWHYKLMMPMHRAVAENMIATLQTPTFQVQAELAIEPLHQAAKSRKLSLSLALARALAVCVTRHPMFNAVYTPRGLATRRRVDVGIAVDVPGGLVTPVIRDAAARPLAELAEDWRILKEKTRKQRLAAEDYQGATIYLSNLGVFPVVRHFTAIVPLGAAAILALGAARDGIAGFTLSCDHRVVYGADAARFLTSLEELLNDPESWLA